MGVMLNLNKKMKFIKCNRYQYLVKRGSISNYSFEIIDEDKSGILEVLFQQVTYPVGIENLKQIILEKCKFIDEKTIEDFLNKLLEIEVIISNLEQEKKIFV